MADTGIRINLSGTLTALPSTMDGRGTYVFEPPQIVRKNGIGEAVTSGFSKLTWKWKSLTQTQWNFINTTVLGGAASKTITGANAIKLYNHMNVLTTYTNCVIQRPTFENVAWGRYINVSWEIEQIA